MRIVILTMGTDGDIRPYLALGKGLHASGHDVCIDAPENFESFITGNGLSFSSIGGDFEALLKSPELTRGLEGNIFWHIPKLVKMFKPFFIDSLRKAWHVAQNAELIIFHPKCLYALDIAEKLEVPAIASGFQPITPTAEFPLLSTHNFGRFLNRVSYNLLYGYSLIYGGIINDFRKHTLGLPARSRLKHPLLSRHTPPLALNAWSRHLSPKPQDWPDNAHVTGFWFLDQADAKLDAKIEHFLSQGDPPLYIGFGSMSWDHKHATVKISQALKLWGGRAIIAKGWGGLEDITADNVLTIDHAPHHLLLPHTCAVVHHGGAGSTAAGLRAGRPTLVCPVIADQPFWGQRIAALAAGPAPARLKKTSADQLAYIFDDLTHSEIYKTHATELGEKIVSEDGIETAINLIGSHP